MASLLLIFNVALTTEHGEKKSFFKNITIDGVKIQICTSNSVPDFRFQDTYLAVSILFRHSVYV
jgi:hypothetical protein